MADKTSIFDLADKVGYESPFGNWRGRILRQAMDLGKPDETGTTCGWGGLDEERQNKFNDALYKFGWKSMLSIKYNNGTLLNHCTNYIDHHDHLHVQGYKPTYKRVLK